MSEIGSWEKEKSHFRVASYRNRTDAAYGISDCMFADVQVGYLTSHHY